MGKKWSRKEIILSVVSSLLLITCIALTVVIVINVKPEDPVEPTVLTGQMEIIGGAEYTEELTNSSSTQFKSLAFDVENLISAAYGHSEIKHVFMSSRVLYFRRVILSRVMVHFDLWFDEQTDAETAEEQLKRGLIFAENTGLDISTVSVKITEKDETDQTTPVPMTTTRQCHPDYKKCADGSTCILSYLFCDGEDDCPDGSDEGVASCATPCDGQYQLRGPSGSFSSWDTYGDDDVYSPTCKWSIRVDQGLAVRVDVQFRKNNVDNLDFYEKVGGKERLTAHVSAFYGPRTVWLLSDNSIVEFDHDPRNHSSGFNATYRTVNISSFSNEQKVMCNFEPGMCLWRQTYEDDRDWERLRRSQRPDTGPSHDHTLGNSSGFFIGSEVLNGTSLSRCKIHSLPLSQTEEPMCLNFWYNMNGANVYRLNVLLQQTSSTTGDVVFQKEGNYGDNWNYGQVTLNLTTETTVVFEALMNRGLLNQIALDDIALTAGACGPAPTEPTSGPVTATPPATSMVTSP